jgi:hypothetical protein
MLILSACVSSSVEPALPTAPPAEGKPVVAISTRCEDFVKRDKKRDAMPPQHRNGKLLLAQRTAALSKALKRMDASYDCQKRQREGFTKG